jgi:hypothetical protein
MFALQHNLRKALVTYTIADPSRNESSKNYEEAVQYYLNLLSEAVANYYERTGQKIQTHEDKFLWEAVVNLNEQHTIEDVKNLAEELSKKYRWQVVHFCAHRDEGHIDLESGVKIFNYHAHILLFMLDKQGIFRFKKRDFGIKKMEELQTFVAILLNMERGVSKKITKKHRLEHPQFRQVMQDQEKYILRITELTNEVRRNENELNKLFDQASFEIIQHIWEIEDLKEWKAKIEKSINKLIEDDLLDSEFSVEKLINYDTASEFNEIMNLKSKM